MTVGTNSLPKTQLIIIIIIVVVIVIAIVAASRLLAFDVNDLSCHSKIETDIPSQP